MFCPYLADLRDRVRGACERGEGSQQEIAQRFGVCPATRVQLATDRTRRGPAGSQTPQPRGSPPAGCAGPLRPCTPWGSTPCAHTRQRPSARGFEAAGLGLLYQPRSSPDLTPIERGWSTGTTRLRAKAARPTEILDADLG